MPAVLAQRRVHPAVRSAAVLHAEGDTAHFHALDDVPRFLRRLNTRSSRRQGCRGGSSGLHDVGDDDSVEQRIIAVSGPTTGRDRPAGLFQAVSLAANKTASIMPNSSALSEARFGRATKSPSTEDSTLSPFARIASRFSPRAKKQVSAWLFASAPLTNPPTPPIPNTAIFIPHTPDYFVHPDGPENLLFSFLPFYHSSPALPAKPPVKAGRHPYPDDPS